MAEEITPEVPVEPVVDPAIEAADAAEAAEWDQAGKDLFPELNKEQKKDEQTDTTTTTTQVPETSTTTTTIVDPNETDEQRTEREAKEAADEAAEAENGAPDTTAISARVAAREAAQAVEAVKSDIRTKMFAEVPQVLQDADGDPIKSIDDVVKLINPRTKEPFTEEEAASWLLSAQQQFNQNLTQVEKQIDQIAEVQVDLKDQADMLTYEYGELLKEMPELQEQLWTEYEKTLVKDEKSGIIIKAPVSLSNFYKLALKPYVDLAAKLEGDAVAKTEADEAAAAKATADAEAAKRQKRQDRSDIYGGGKTDTQTEDEKEWGAAAKSVFGDQLKL